jgi:hypothetical protein
MLTGTPLLSRPRGSAMAKMRLGNVNSKNRKRVRQIRWTHSELAGALVFLLVALVLCFTTMLWVAQHPFD